MFLWTHKEVDLSQHPVVGLVLQVGDAEKFPQALGFESLDPFFRLSKQGQYFTVIEENDLSPCYKDHVTNVGTKTMSPKRKSMPRSSRQSDHVKTS